MGVGYAEIRSIPDNKMTRGNDWFEVSSHENGTEQLYSLCKNSGDDHI